MPHIKVHTSLGYLTLSWGSMEGGNKGSEGVGGGRMRRREGIDVGREGGKKEMEEERAYLHIHPSPRRKNPRLPVRKEKRE